MVIFGLKESTEEDKAALENAVIKEIFKDSLGIEVHSVECIHRSGYKNIRHEQPVIL